MLKVSYGVSSCGEFLRNPRSKKGSISEMSRNYEIFSRKQKIAFIRKEKTENPNAKNAKKQKISTLSYDLSIIRNHIQSKFYESSGLD